MKVVVQKYGGSSVADVDKLRRVAQRIAASRAQGYAVVVVASAMGNTTDELVALAHSVSKSPARRELDMLLSVGERVAMALLAMALGDLGVPAMSLTGSQSGIVTDEAHADANVVEVRPDRVRVALEAGKVVIVAGFQGVSRAREVTTLGRGGSDTTAVVLAAALKAEYCEICSDVDGVWSADPRVVPTARKLDQLWLEEACQLAGGGAKILYEDAVRYARDQGVAIRAASTFGPGSGTRITATGPARRGAVAVTGDRKLVRLDLDGIGPGVLDGVRLRCIADGVVFVDVRNVHGTLGDLETTPAALVTAVGRLLGGPIALGGSAALAEAGITVLRRGANADAAWWEVDPEVVDAAVAAVHDAVVSTP